MYEQLRPPNTSVKAADGWCLWFVQEVYKVPHLYRSAWEAWKAVDKPHSSRVMPNVSVPVWFSHYGIYGTPPTYGNWGHVVAWIPERKKFLSVIGKGYGQQWFNSLEEIEGYFNAKYVGWSEDLSKVKIVEESKMTEELVFIFFRFYLGRQPSKNDIKNYSGVTIDRALSSIKGSAEFKARIKDSEDGKLEPIDHNPTEIRVVYKEPAVTQLKKGTYEVQ